MLGRVLQESQRRIRIKMGVAPTNEPAIQENRKVIRGRRRRHRCSKEQAKEPKSTPEAWFCCLMKQLEGQCKNETSIQVSQRPLETVYEHNSGTVNDKSTKPARGHWMPEMLVGPLPSEEEANRFKAQWMQKSRGILSKREFGIEEAKKWREVYPNLRCYDKRCVPLDYNGFLRNEGIPELCVSERALNDMKRRLKACRITERTK